MFQSAEDLLLKRNKLECFKALQRTLEKILQINTENSEECNMLCQCLLVFLY